MREPGEAAAGAGGAWHAGVDIGGTKVSVAVARSGGPVLVPGRIENRPVRPLPVLAEAVAAMVAELAAREGLAGRPEAVGIGCPGPLDRATGVILQDPTLPGWAGQSVTEAMGRVLGARCVLENDAVAALAGEVAAGAALGADSAVMLTFGTGVGGAAWAGGRVVRGVRGEHPEAGHMVVRPGGRLCSCGQRGCLESIAGGAALEARAAEVGAGSVDELFRRAGAGQPAAAAVVEEAVEAVAAAVAILVHVLAPSCVVLGGGVMERQYEVLAERAGAVGALPFVAHFRPRVVKAALGGAAGVVGAVELARGLPVRGGEP